MKTACNVINDDHRDACLEEFLEHTDALYGFALRLTKTSDDANDLVQDTYLRAVRYVDHYERGTNTRSWLFRMMHNLFINNYHREKKNPIIKMNEDNDYQFDVAVKPEVYQHTFSDEVMIAFNGLNPNMKAALFLCDVENLKYDEIAEILSIPLCTVKTRIHRARSSVKKSLLNSGFFIRNN
ncbi:MAG: RNA polymerase sigma factor [Bacteroidota bacterium]